MRTCASEHAGALTVFERAERPNIAIGCFDLYLAQRYCQQDAAPDKEGQR